MYVITVNKKSSFHTVITIQRFVCIAYWYNHICTKIKAKREKK